MAEVHYPSQPDLLRAKLRAGLAAKRQRDRAGRILELQREERAAIRAAEAERAASAKRRPTGAEVKRSASRRLDVDSLAARRRDQYMRALAYPMTGRELASACADAVRSAGVPTDDQPATAGELAARVIAQHGREPLRSDVGREWLISRAALLYSRMNARRERSTERTKAAARLAEWTAADKAAESEREAAADPVYWAAARLPAPVETTPLDASEVSERLSLTERQAAALTRALESEQRVTAAMSPAERKAAADAKRILTARFPDVAALRFALHGWRFCAESAEAAVTHVIALQRVRSAVAGSGSQLPGRSAPLGGGALTCERVSHGTGPDPYVRSVGPRGPVPAARWILRRERSAPVDQRPVWERTRPAQTIRAACESIEHRSAARALTLSRWHVLELSGAPLPARVQFTASEPVAERRPRPVTRQSAGAALAALRSEVTTRS